MENLADEKLLLEQRLASEKLALNTEKQGLEEQLRVALTKLHEAEQLLEQEKTLSLQYEALHQQVVNENHGLQQSLHEQMEHNNELQSQLMKLQASSEKDYVLIENYRKRIEEDDEKILNLNDEIEKFKSYQVEWENEKDDLLNQITILTDERDSARQHEEELYSILKEKTNDLERLQESYVDMTDRCNDYQDSMAEMREEMESLKEVMLAESRQFITASQSATGIYLSPYYYLFVSHLVSIYLALRPRNISDPSHYPSSAMDSNPPNTTYSSHTTREEYSQEPSSASLVSSLSVPPTIHSPPSIISEPYISPVHNPSLSSEETTKPQAAKATAAAASKASTAYEEEYAADDNDYEEEFEDDFES